MITVVQEAVGPEDLVICDSHDGARGLFEAHGLLEAVASDALLEMDDLDEGPVRGGEVIGLDGRENSLDYAVSVVLKERGHKAGVPVGLCTYSGQRW